MFSKRKLKTPGMGIEFLWCQHLELSSENHPGDGHFFHGFCLVDAEDCVFNIFIPHRFVSASV